MSDTKFNSNFSELDNNESAETYSVDAAQDSADGFGRTLSEEEALNLATSSVNLDALEQHMASSRPSGAIDWRARARAAQMNDGHQPLYAGEIQLEEPMMEPSFAEAEGHPTTGRPTNTVLAATATSPATTPEPVVHLPIVHTPSAHVLDESPAFFGTEPIQVHTQERTRPAYEPIEGAVEVDLTADITEVDADMVTEPLSETTDMAVLADEAAALETKVLAAGAIPPERVRFTAPLELMVEGDADLHRGAVLNMSATGVACAMDIELSPGQRVWIRFRLSLADEPVSLLCTVIWRRGANETHVLYGLQFTSLTDEEAQRIDTTVRERLEGKAADWPLPLMPAPGPVARTGKTARVASGWTSAAFGMIGGMGLALALSALPHFSSQTPSELTEELVEAPPAVTAEALPPTSSAMAFGAQQEGPQLPGAIAQKMDAIDIPTVEPVAAEPKLAVAPPSETVAKAPASAPAAKPAPVVVAKAPSTPAKPVVAAKADSKSAQKEGNLPRKASPDHAEVTLASGTSATKPHAFWLENPHRYVVDVPGKHPASTQAAESPLVSKVRVGSYEDKTRYVFEVASNVKDAKVEPRGNALVVKLSK